MTDNEFFKLANDIYNDMEDGEFDRFRAGVEGAIKAKNMLMCMNYNNDPYMSESLDDAIGDLETFLGNNDG